MGAGCSETPTVVLVKVAARDGVADADHLRVDLQLSLFRDPPAREFRLGEGRIFPAGGARTTRLVIRADGRKGRATVVVRARRRPQLVPLVRLGDGLRP